MRDVVKVRPCYNKASAGDGQAQVDDASVICGRWGARSAGGVRCGSRPWGRRDPFFINSHPNATSEHLNSISVHLIRTRVELAATAFSRYEKRLNRVRSGLEQPLN